MTPLIFSFVLYVPFLLFVALLKQTENIREVVRPNYVSLHSRPARIVCNRSQGGAVTRHHYPNRRILAVQAFVLIPGNKPREPGAFRQAREQRFKIQMAITDVKRKHPGARQLVYIP